MAKITTTTKEKPAPKKGAGISTPKTKEERLTAFQNKFTEIKFESPADTKAYFTDNENDFSELCFLYEGFFKMDIGNCKNNVLGAFLQVMKFDLNTYEDCPFKLFAGALIEDNVTFDSTKAMSNYNITTELSLFHLSQNPLIIDRFQSYPENWKELIKAKAKDVK